MLPRFLSNKYFVLFVSVTFLLYILTPKITFAGGKSTFLGWLITGLSIILTVIAIVVTYGAASPMLLSASTLLDVVTATISASSLTLFGIVGLTQALIIGASVLSAAMTITSVVGTGLCLSGTDSPFYTGCGSTPPSVYYIGGGTYNSKATAPVISNFTNTPTCNSIKLCYSVKNATQYALYRSGSLITQSETCIPTDGGAYSFCYTDTGLSHGTSYDYRLVLYDALGQPLLFPISTISTLSSCP